MAEQWSAGEEPEQRGPIPQIAQPEPQAEASPSSSKAGWIVSALVGIALLTGVGYSTGVFSPTVDPQPAPIAVTAPAQQQHGFSLLQPVVAGDQGSAMQALLLSEADKGKVAKAVQDGGTRLAWLAVSDSGAEDGDIVTVSGAGFSQTVPLLKKQTRLAVPYTPGTPIRVVGTKDGSSPGITVAVYVGGNVFRLKTMTEGETIEIASP